MSAEEIKALIRHRAGELNKGKVAALADTEKVCATNLVVHDAIGREIHGLNEYKQAMSADYDVSPDIHYTLDDIIVEGEKAVIR
jgi:predicted ester cyclase